MNRPLSIFVTVERAPARAMAAFLLIVTITIAAEPMPKLSAAEGQQAFV